MDSEFNCFVVQKEEMLGQNKLLTLQVADLKRQVSELESRLQLSKSEQAEFAKRNARVSEESAAHARRGRELADALAALERAHSASQARAKRLETELMTLQAELAKIRNIRLQIDGLKKQGDDKENSQQQTPKDASIELKNAQLEAIRIGAENRGLRQELEAGRSELEKASQQIEHLLADQEHAEAIMTENNQKIADLSLEVEGLKAQLAASGAELANLRAGNSHDAAQLRQESKELNARIIKLLEAESEFQSQLETKNNDIIAKNAEILEEKSKREQAQRALAELKEACAALAGEKLALVAAQQEAAAECERLRRDLEESKACEQSLAEEAVGGKSRRLALQMENEKAVLLYESALFENKELKIKLDNANTELRKSAKEREALSQQLRRKASSLQLAANFKLALSAKPQRAPADPVQLRAVKAQLTSLRNCLRQIRDAGKSDSNAFKGLLTAVRALQGRLKDKNLYLAGQCEMARQALAEYEDKLLESARARDELAQKLSVQLEHNAVQKNELQIFKDQTLHLSAQIRQLGDQSGKKA